MDPDCYRLAVGVYRTSICTTTRVAIDSTQAQILSKREPPESSRKKQQHTLKLPSLRQGLAYLSLLVPAHAKAQSFVGGDLSRQAPYGLPAQDFAAAFSSPISDATFPIRGYNTSLPASADPATDHTVDGWSLTISIAANVPLANSANAAVDKSLCTDATALSISPPAGVQRYNNTGWRVCAVVFTGGLKAVGEDTKTDGTCSAVLPDDCIRQLQVNSAASKAGRAGGCQNLALPDSCAGHLNGNAGTAFEITPIGSSAVADRRSMFFAAGFEPVRKGNMSSLAAVQRHIWPVLLAWTHFDEAGEAQDSAGWLSCAKTTESKEVTGGGRRLGAENVLSIAGWLFLIWVMSIALMFN